MTILRSADFRTPSTSHRRGVRGLVHMEPLHWSILSVRVEEERMRRIVLRREYPKAISKPRFGQIAMAWDYRGKTLC
jgi:hypothetical protein